MALSFLDKLKEVDITKAKDALSDVSASISKISDGVSNAISNLTNNQDESKDEKSVATIIKSEDTDIEEVDAEVVEKEGSKMLQVMDWAFEKAQGNIPGFGTSHEMAQRYLEENGTVSAAIDKLINWQITSAATTGFVTNLGGLATMPITLPANIAGVMAIQLRMIGAIAEMGGWHENTEEKKTAMYLCLLGSQAGNVLSKTASQFAIKFGMASLKKLPGTVLTKINQRVGFRLLTKFGEKGLVNIHKLIPIIGGIVGGTIDALSTYAIAQAAKAFFLDDIINFEKQEKIEATKIHLLINLAQVDNNYDVEEKFLIKSIIEGLNLSPQVRKSLHHDVEHPKRFEVDLTPFKEDLVLSSSTLHVLCQVANIGGITPVEKIYINQIGKQMGCDENTINLLMP